jgi:hypothetical protein
MREVFIVGWGTKLIFLEKKFNFFTSNGQKRLVLKFKLKI